MKPFLGLGSNRNVVREAFRVNLSKCFGVKLFEWSGAGTDSLAWILKRQRNEKSNHSGKENYAALLQLGRDRHRVGRIPTKLSRLGGISVVDPCV